MNSEETQTQSACVACTGPVDPSILVILDKFFTFTSVGDAIKTIRQMFVAAISAEESAVWTQEHRAHMAFVYQELSELLETLND